MRVDIRRRIYLQKKERTRRTEEKAKKREKHAYGEISSKRGKKTTKQLEKRRRPHFMLAGIGSL